MLSCLLYLSKYFYVCDERQIEIVRNILVQCARESGAADQLAQMIFYNIRDVLNETEKKAIAEQFIYPHRPPVRYFEGNEEIDRTERIGRYSLNIYKIGGLWHDDLEVSMGLDMVLLPITAGILYNYVTDKIPSESRIVLDSCVTALLDRQATSNFRSLKTARQLVNTVIAENFN